MLTNRAGGRKSISTSRLPADRRRKRPEIQKSHSHEQHPCMVCCCQAQAGAPARKTPAKASALPCSASRPSAYAPPTPPCVMFSARSTTPAPGFRVCSGILTPTQKSKRVFVPGTSLLVAAAFTFSLISCGLHVTAPCRMRTSSPWPRRGIIRQNRDPLERPASAINRREIRCGRPPRHF
jgi:hypothetical protein